MKIDLSWGQNARQHSKRPSSGKSARRSPATRNVPGNNRSISRRGFETLESRLLFDTTIPITNPGFETLYKPGTTDVFATLPAGVGTFDQRPFGPAANLKNVTRGGGMFTTANIIYSDGTPGNQVDVPGWTAPAFPATYGGIKNLTPVTGANPLYAGKGDNVLYLQGPGATRGQLANPYGFGPSYQTVTQQLTTDVQPNTLYTLSVDIGWSGDLNKNLHAEDANGNVIKNVQLALPIIANIEINGSSLTLVSSNVNQLLEHDLTPGTFHTLTETFYSASSVPANTPLTVALGLGPATNKQGVETDFDNVALTSAPAAQSSIVNASIAGSAINSAATQQSITVNYSSTAAAIDPSTIGAGNLIVVTPFGNTMTVNAPTTMVNGDGSVTAMYVLPAAAGGFSAADNGSYTILTVPGSVQDLSGNAIGLATGSFLVSIAPNTTVTYLGGSGAGSLQFTSEDVTTQSDGKTIVAGHDGYAFDFKSPSEAVLQRFNADATGTLDTSFNGGNFATLPASTGISAFFGVVVQSDGKIVAVGTDRPNPALGADMVIARFNSDGTLDPTFGAGGVVQAGINGNSEALTVTIDPNGKIVAAGTNLFGDYVLIRLNVNGSADSTFNPGGVNNSVDPGTNSGAKYSLEGAFATVNGGEERISAGQGGNAIDKIVLAPNPDGSPFDYNIIAVGTASTNIAVQDASGATVTDAEKVVALIEVDSTGATNGFGGDLVPTLTGSVAVPGLHLIQQLRPQPLGTDVSKSPIGVALDLQGDIIVAAGTPDPGTPANTDFGTVRLTQAGVQDFTFGNSGFAITTFQTTQAFANDVTVTPTQIVVYGVTYGTSGFQSALAVYTSAGQPDPTFDAMQVATGITTDRAYHPQSSDFGLSAGAVNSDGTGIFTTTDPNNGTASTLARFQVRAFPQLSSNYLAATTDFSTTQFTVTFSAPAGTMIDGSTLDAANLTITNASGQRIPVILLSQSDVNAQTVNVVYQISSPTGGDWVHADSGSYAVSLIPNGVKYTNGNFLQSGQFANLQLFVTDPLPMDLSAGKPVGAIPASVVGGSKFKGVIKVLVTNTSSATVSGKYVLNLYASLSNNTLNGATLLTPRGVVRNMTLKPGKGGFMNVNGFAWPAAQGNYYLIATVAQGSHGSNNGSTTSTVQVAQPFVDIQALDVEPAKAKLVLGHNTVFVTVKNAGNVVADVVGQAAISVTFNGTTTPIATVPIRIRLKPGQSKKGPVVFKTVTLPAAGTYFVTVDLVQLTQDSDNSNNSATSQLQVTV